MKRCNVFMQRELSSCGACSVESIVSYYGGYVPHETVLEDTFTNKYGTNAHHLIKALEKYGFNSYGIKIDIDKLDIKYLPVIAHTNKNGYEHFLVIYDIKGNSVITMDPQYGKKVYEKGEFKKIFTNVAIIAIPKVKIVKFERKSSLKKVFMGEFSKDKFKIFTLIVLNFFFMIASIFSTFYIKLGATSNNLLNITLIFMVVVSLKYFIAFIKALIEEIIAIKVGNRINKKFISHIFKLQLRYLENKRVGEIVSKLDDINYIKDWLLKVTLSGSIDLIIFFVGSIMLISISIKLASITILCFIIYIVLTLIMSGPLYKKEMNTLDTYNSYRGDVVEYLDGIKSIKNLNKENFFISRINSSFSNYTMNNYKVYKYSLYTNNFKDAFLEICFILSCFLALKYIQSQTFSLLNLITFNSIYSLVYSSLSNIMSFIPSFMHVKAIFRNVSEFLDVLEEDDSMLLNLQFKSLKIDKLVFSYDHYRDSIKGLNLKILKGDKILLTGPSGSGKSTIAKCIAGYFDDYKGNITLNDVEIKNISKESIRNFIVYIGQDEKLFSGTIKYNITYEKVEYKLFCDVLDLSNVRDIIESKRERENDLILEGGNNLSGGEKARIILARALYRKPAILIIDEALSSVPEEQENDILDKLLEKEDLTLIYITHRDKRMYFKKCIQIRKDGNYEIKGM